MYQNSQEYFPADYQFNLSDFALFLSVMKNKRAYECTLSIILDEPDIQLKEVKVEQVILNHTGKRAIRLDAWAQSEDERQFNMEMQNENSDHFPKRSRFYQGMLDTPVLKSGKRTKYRNLPSTVIIFITQDDIFKKNLAKYTFTEQCEEVPGLHLEDGTKKIFLNMSSLNGSQELVSLLQYMKETRIDNPNITVKDSRILELDQIVTDVKESEEWEVLKMNILEMGLKCGREDGLEEGRKEGRTEGYKSGLDEGIHALIQLCQELGMTCEETEQRLMEKFPAVSDQWEDYMKRYWDGEESFHEKES